MLNIVDTQNIINAVLKEAETNEDFKSIVFEDVEQAISLIIERDFSNDIQKRYNQMIDYYKNTQTNHP